MKYLVVSDNDISIIHSGNDLSDCEISQIFDDLYVPHSPIVIESLEDVQILLDCGGAYKFKLTDDEYEKIFVKRGGYNAN